MSTANTPSTLRRRLHRRRCLLSVGQVLTLVIAGCGSSVPPYTPATDALVGLPAPITPTDAADVDVSGDVDVADVLLAGSDSDVSDAAGDMSDAAGDVKLAEVSPSVADTEAADASGVPTSAGCGVAPKHKSGGVQLTLNVGPKGDGERSFYLVLPKNYDPMKPHRLIFGFAGTNGNGVKIRSYLKLEDGADDEIFVYPDPLTRSFKGWGSYGGWLLGPHAQPAHGEQDLYFVEALMDYLGDHYCIDTSRIFASGQSWGGDMAMVTACFLGDRIRASAPSAANRPYWFEKAGGTVKCVGEAALWIFFGQADNHFTTQKYPGEFGDQCRDFWVKERQCSSPLTSSKLPYDAPGSCVAYEGCSAPVRYCLYDKKTGHQIPSYFSAAVRSWFRSF